MTTHNHDLQATLVATLDRVAGLTPSLRQHIIVALAECGEIGLTVRSPQLEAASAARSNAMRLALGNARRMGLDINAAAAAMSQDAYTEATRGRDPGERMVLRRQLMDVGLIRD